MVHRRRGAPIVDHHNRVFSGKGRRVTLVGGERPQGHKILHHVAVPELVLDGVGVVQANLIKELLEVVRGRVRLMLAAECDNHSAHHDGVACVFVDAIVIVGRGCGLLVALLAPLLAALDALLSILDYDVGRRFPVTALGWVKLGRLVADSVLGDNAAQLLSGVLDGVGRCLERP
jgi:hypothetical protein